MRSSRGTVDALLQAGYWLRTDEHDDPRPEQPTQDRDAIVKEIAEVDDEFLAVWFEAPSAEDRRPNAWVRFVYGNDGWDVICDYTTNLETVLQPIIDYADTLQ